MSKNPHFLAFGAMENWGAITYRITALLATPGLSSLSRFKRISDVIAHELAHQWFGDIVTMAWWNDLWLNEGFASFVENLGVNYTHPEYSIWEDFARSGNGALDIDSSIYTHSIQADVEDPQEIDTLFDTITFSLRSLSFWTDQRPLP